ncbi:MAG: glutamate--tRNA ligase family protein, partial [Longimicrobiales bacterium]
VDMAISHVIRGSGHLSNTPKQALLFDALGVPRPVFAHLAQVLDPAGGKLSKRSGAKPVSAYREEGYLPDALVNYLSLLGWSDPDEREVLTRSELVEAISLERLGASDTAYDPEKLRWVAQQHLAALPLEEVVAGVEPILRRAGAPFDGWSGAERVSAVEALRSRLAAFGDVAEHLHFFEPTDEQLAEARRTVSRDPAARTVIDALIEALSAVSDEEWTPETVKAAVKEAGAAAGARGKGLYTPLRLAVTGQEHGPDVARILHVLGRTRTLGRLRAA